MGDIMGDLNVVWFKVWTIFLVEQKQLNSSCWDVWLRDSNAFYVSTTYSMEFAKYAETPRNVASLLNSKLAVKKVTTSNLS